MSEERTNTENSTITDPEIEAIKQAVNAVPHTLSKTISNAQDYDDIWEDAFNSGDSRIMYSVSLVECQDASGVLGMKINASKPTYRFLFKTITGAHKFLRGLFDLKSCKYFHYYTSSLSIIKTTSLNSVNSFRGVLNGSTQKGGAMGNWGNNDMNIECGAIAFVVKELAGSRSVRVEIDCQAVAPSNSFMKKRF